MNQADTYAYSIQVGRDKEMLGAQVQHYLREFETMLENENTVGAQLAEEKLHRAQHYYAACCEALERTNRELCKS